MNKLRMKTILLAAVAVLVTLTGTATAQVIYQNLGTTAAPGTLGTFTMIPFSATPQAAIADSTSVSTIPGNPIAGSLTVSPSLDKRTVPGGGWSTWSHGYAGPVFFNTANTATLTLPPNTGAFYFYVEPMNFNIYQVTAVTDTGTSSGPISVNGSAGATGFAFYTSGATSIATIAITADSGAGGFALGEFGIAANTTEPVPTLSEIGFIAMFLLLAAVATRKLFPRTA